MGGRSHGYAGPACRSQALPADMVSKHTKTLRNMNSTTAKYAKWHVRVIDPKVIDYSFTARREDMEAKKFQRALVSREPEQHMYGLAPFSIKDRNAAKEAALKFTANSVWELTMPTFDSKVKPEFIGCPVKSVVWLCKPTVVTMVPQMKSAAYTYPAMGIKVALDIKGIMELLKGTAGGASDRRSFDFCGTFLSIGADRQVQVAGATLSVADAEFMDARGG